MKIQKGLPDESIESPDTSDNTLAPALSYFGNNARVKLDVCFL